MAALLTAGYLLLAAVLAAAYTADQRRYRSRIEPDPLGMGMFLGLFWPAAIVVLLAVRAVDWLAELFRELVARAQE